jgi:hypothetical protein
MTIVTSILLLIFSIIWKLNFRKEWKRTACVRTLISSLERWCKTHYIISIDQAFIFENFLQKRFPIVPPLKAANKGSNTCCPFPFFPCWEFWGFCVRIEVNLINWRIFSTLINTRVTTLYHQHWSSLHLRKFPPKAIPYRSYQCNRLLVVALRFVSNVLCTENDRLLEKLIWWHSTCVICMLRHLVINKHQ